MIFTLLTGLLRDMSDACFNDHVEAHGMLSAIDLLGACRSSLVDQSGKMSILGNIYIAPENRPSQKETNLPTIHFQRLC